uniref:Uncharacterized protein n=1 Tax=Anopheles darlingi TaxID=43151 RepID=A0A2M4DF08_ANODA
MIPCVYSFSAMVMTCLAFIFSFRDPSFSSSTVSMGVGRHLFFGFSVTFTTFASGFDWHSIKYASQHCLSNRRFRAQLNSTVRSSIVCVNLIFQKVCGIKFSISLYRWATKPSVGI